MNIVCTFAIFEPVPFEVEFVDEWQKETHTERREGTNCRANVDDDEVI